MVDKAARDLPPDRPPQADGNAQWALRQVHEALHGLQFGQVTVIVQDGVVVQVERLERRRFRRGT
jgi:hypothetical protein